MERDIVLGAPSVCVLDPVAVDNLRKAVQHVTLWTSSAPVSTKATTTTTSLSRYQRALAALSNLSAAATERERQDCLEGYFGCVEGKAVWREYFREPTAQVALAVRHISEAIQHSFLSPLLAQHEGREGELSSPKSLGDFDIHVVWQPYSAILSRNEAAVGGSLDGIVATATVRYLPALKRRGLMIDVLQASMLSAAAPGQSLQSSLAFWEDVHCDDEDSKQRGRRRRRDTNDEGPDGDDREHAGKTEAEQPQPQHELVALLGRIESIPVVSRSLLRPVPLSSLYLEDDDGDEPASSPGGTLRVPVLTSLPSDTEAEYAWSGSSNRGDGPSQLSSPSTSTTTTVVLGSWHSVYASQRRLVIQQQQHQRDDESVLSHHTNKVGEGDTNNDSDKQRHWRGEDKGGGGGGAATHLILQERRRRWERRCVRSSGSEPLWLQPDAWRQGGTSDVTAAAPAAPPRQVRRQRDGLSQHELQGAMKRNVEERLKRMPPLSHCGLVAHFTITREGVLYCGYTPGAAVSDPQQHLQPTEEQPLQPTVSASHREEKNTSMFQQSYVPLEDQRSFTRGLLGLS